MPYTVWQFILWRKSSETKCGIYGAAQGAGDMVKEMHDLWNKGYTPKVKPQKGCNACSLKEICIPKLGRVKTIKDYIEKSLLRE